MRRLIPAALVVLLLAPTAATAADDARPIPQDPERQQQRYQDMLAWNRRTLEGAYDPASKRHRHGDKCTCKVLETAARYFSHTVDPGTSADELRVLSGQAMSDGCRDPMLPYLHALSATPASAIQPVQRDLLYSESATAIEKSAYPPFRKAIVLARAGLVKAGREDLAPEKKKKAAQWLDAAVALLPVSAAQDERTPDLENNWFEVAGWAIDGHQELTGDARAAFDRVDAALAKTPALRALRLKVRGRFFLYFGWDARGTGSAATVTEEGGRLFYERLTEAREALEESWALQPGDTWTATLMLEVEKGIGGDRAEMEKWFERAMEANGNNASACAVKLDWLDPKWHGNLEEMLAFGRACRATKNWRAGITLLVADAHHRTALRLPKGQGVEYLRSAAVWDEIRAVYEEYLAHKPFNYHRRSEYAAYCYMCGRIAEAAEQFRTVGDDLVGSNSMPESWLQQIRAHLARPAQAAPAAETPVERRDAAKPPK
jgi:hypothetical protein